MKYAISQFFFIIISFTVQSQVNLSEGLLAYYPFNSNAQDESGNGYHGTVHGAQICQDRFGNGNSAYEFNGLDNYITIPDGILQSDMQSFTISLWALPNGSADQSAFYHGSYNGEAQLSNTAFSVKLADGEWYTANFELTNQWTHLVGIYNKGNYLKIFVNGTFHSTVSIPWENLFVELLHHSSIGVYNRGELNFWNGKIDDIRVYNRILTSDEITTLYTGSGIANNMISGRIFEDMNLNGVFDGEDIPQSTGWQVNIQGPVNQSVFPNSDGTYLFDNLPSGTYKVFETVPDDWTVIAPVWGGYEYVTINAERNGNVVDFANFNLQRANDEMEFLYFPNGQHTGDNTAGIGTPDAPNQSGPIDTTQIPPNAYHIKMKRNAPPQDTIFINKNSIVQLAVTSDDQYTHIFKFTDPALKAIALGLGPHETRMITFKAYNLVPGNTYEYYCDMPGHNEVGYFHINYEYIPPLPAPVLVSPGNGGVLDGPPYQFEWQGVEGASLYHIKVADNPSFTDPLINNDTISGQLTTFESSMTLVYGQTYYWQMRTLNSVGTEWGTWSNYQNFTINYPTPGTINGRIFEDININGVYDVSDLPQSNGWQVNIEGPVGQSVTPNPDGTFSFSNIPPGLYSVYETVPEDWTVISPAWGGNYTFTLSPGELKDSVDFANFDMQRDNNDMEVLVFPNSLRTGDNTVEPSSPTAPQQSGPIDTTQIMPNSKHIKLTLNDPEQQTIYATQNSIIFLAVTSDDQYTHIFKFEEPELNAIAIGVGPHETRMIAFKTYNLPAGNTYHYYCDVPGHGEHGYLVITENTLPDAPQLISPSNLSNVNSPEITFDWSDVSGAIRYELYVDNNSGFGSPEISSQHLTELENLTESQFTISGNWLPQNPYYWKVIAITPNGNVESSTGQFTYLPPKANQPNWVPLYRAYNGTDADHFYCSAQNHLQQAIEGDYNFESVEGYVSLVPFEVSSPDTLKNIFRFYIPENGSSKTKCHYYTTNESDRDNRIIQGWIYEGITGYCYNRPGNDLVKLHHTWLNIPGDRMDNFYTTSEIEKNHSISAYGYTDQGFIGYISATGGNSTLTWLENSFQAGYGINPQNGNLAQYHAGMLTIKEGKIGLSFGHFYNSGTVRLFSTINPLGNGWNHNYNIYLNQSDSNIFIHWPSEVHVYNVSYQPETLGVYDELTKTGTTSFEIKKKNQTVFSFEQLSSKNIQSTFVLKSITDRFNNQVLLEYDAYGKLKWVKTPKNKYITFTYYPDSDPQRAGLVKYVKDSLALNRTIEYIFDDNRNLVKFIDVIGKETTYTYNQASPFDHFLAGINYPDGVNVSNTYDSLSKRITEQQIGSGKGVEKTTISLPENKQVTISDALNKTLQVDFDDLGNIEQLLTANGDVTYAYDNPAHPTKPTEIIDGMGYETTIEYDINGNPVRISKPQGIAHQYTWNSDNDLTTYINPKNIFTTFTYVNKKLTAVQTPRGTTNMTYYLNGNIQSITNALDQTTTFSYDANDNLKSIEDNLGNTTSYTNDAAGRVLTSTDANGNPGQFIYDDRDLLTKTIDALNHETKYGYDDNLRLTSVTDAMNNVTSMTYDNTTGWLDHSTDQLGNQTNYQYFDNGTLQSITDRKGQTTYYGYDSTNRLVSVSVPDINRNYTYNDNDIITQISDNNGDLNFGYDSLNRLISYSDYFGNEVQYQYDTVGNTTKIIYPGNKTVEYSYYDDNLLFDVKDWLGNTTTYYYRDDGSLDYITNANGTTVAYGYDNAGRMTSLINKNSSDDIICAFSFTLDSVGNHIEEDMNIPLEYPELPLSDVAYSYDAANRILSAGVLSFTHDQNGNLTQQNGNKGNISYSYNSEDYLTGVSGDFNATFMYDAMGKRRSASRNGQITRYVLDVNREPENVLVETDGSDNPMYYYIYGYGLLYRIKASDNSMQQYHYDFRGSTIAISDENENITHKYLYDAFGTVVATEEPANDFNRFRYVGKYGVMYEDSMLYFMRVRYYRPDLGRFLSEDPVWNVNGFVYAGQNPIFFYDPDGNKKTSFAKALNWAKRTFSDGEKTNFIMRWADKLNISDALGDALLSIYPELGYYSPESDKELERLQNNLYQLAKDMEFAFDVGELIRGFEIHHSKSFATKVFGKGGWLKVVDMRTRSGLVIKTFWELGENGIMHIILDE